MRKNIINFLFIVLSLNCSSQVLDSINWNQELYAVSYNRMRTNTMDGDRLISEFGDTIVINSIQWNLRNDSLFKVKTTKWHYTDYAHLLENLPLRKQESINRLFCSSCTDSIYILSGVRETYRSDTLPYPLKVNLIFENGLLIALDTVYNDSIIYQIKMANEKVHNWNSIQDTIFNYVQQNLSTEKPIEDRFYVVLKKGYVTKVRVIPHMFYGSIPYQHIEDRKSSRRLLKSLKDKDFSNLVKQDLFVVDVYIGFDSEKQMYELEHTVPELFFYKTNANKK